MANIRRKFERWFKHCDESNLKVERRAIAQCPPERLQTAAKSMFRRGAREFVNRRDWRDGNHAAGSAPRAERHEEARALP